MTHVSPTWRWGAGAALVWALAVPACAGPPRDGPVALPQEVSTSSPPPPGWQATSDQVSELVLTDPARAVALLEVVVKDAPAFADGHGALGGAYEMLARRAAGTDPAQAAPHFEAAARHLRRAFDLGGGEYPGANIRGLVELYDSMSRPDLWKATVLDAVQRYPAEPVSHWFMLQLLLREQREAEIPAALRAASQALAESGRNARLEYAGTLVGLAERTSSSTRAALADEALAVANAVLKAEPTSLVVGMRVEKITEDVTRLRAR